MYDPELLVERLQALLEALKRIPRRFADITTPTDFIRRPRPWPWHRPCRWPSGR